MSREQRYIQHLISKTVAPEYTNLVKRSKDLTSDFLVEAAQGGHLRTVLWCFPSHPDYREYMVNIGCVHGYLDILQHFFQNEPLMLTAIITNQRGVIRYLQSIGQTEIFSNQTSGSRLLDQA